jgi:HEAT repeat protein
MSNPDTQHDPNEPEGEKYDSLNPDDLVSDRPPQNQVDLSQYDDDPGPDYAIAGDDDAVKKINRRTSTFGRIVTVALIVGAVGLGGFAFWTQQRAEEQKQKLEAIGEMPKEKVPGALRDLLPKLSNPDLKRRALKNLGHYKDEQSIPLLIDHLKHGGKIRRAAAWALAKIGPPKASKAKDELLKVLPKTDSRDRAQVVWTLAVLGEEKAADAILEQFSKGMLQNLDGFDPKVIVDVLGPERLASDALLKHEKESVRRLTAHALGESGSKSALEPLSKLLEYELGREAKKQSTEVIRAAAAGLGRIGDPAAARPLFNVLKNKPNMAQAVLDALRQSTAAPKLALLAKEAEQKSVQRDLVRLLSNTHDPQIADDLAHFLDSDDTEIRNTAAFALADIRDARAAPVLFELARADDQSQADRALGGLMKIANPDMTDELLTLLDEEEGRRATIVRILGETGDSSVGPEIKKVLDTDDVGAAAEALATLDYDPTYDKMLRMAERPRDKNMAARSAADRKTGQEKLRKERRAAIEALGIYGRSEAFETLTTIVEDDEKEDYELRRKSAASVGRVATADQMKKVIDKIQDDTLDERSRRYYVQALWQKPHPELSGEMLDLAADSEAPIPVRRAAALAVGYAGKPGNDARIAEMLDKEEMRRHAAFAAVLGADQKTSEKLRKVLSEDREVRDILQNALSGDRNWFMLLNEEMFESNQIYRRLHTSDVLNSGGRETAFGYAWTRTINTLRSGWGGPFGVSAHYVRQELYGKLADDGSESKHRKLAAKALAAIPERGLLLRARNQEGKTGQIARDVLSGRGEEDE